MAESTRPLPPLIPLSNGGWEANSFMSSPGFTLRGLALMPPNHVVPIIVVPGIMGTNLRAKQHPRVDQTEDERNKKVRPGQPAWRPPNGAHDGLSASFEWDRFSPKERQELFDPTTLEVDDRGPILLPEPDDGYVLSESEARQRGWGEVHADSYGRLLHVLQTRLNQTFGFDEHDKKRFVRQHWKDVMAYDSRKWGVRDFAALTEHQLVKHAQHYFPVYAVGYSWLLDCRTSSMLLERRILAIIEFWKKAKRRCDNVILVTHSMGGLVARACAQRIPEKIAGVIHGVMPALGAPVTYRRIACGTETSSPSNGSKENFEASRLARILGDNTDETTPVLATSPGALELLPNHMYPAPWLHVRVIKSVGAAQPAAYNVKDGAVRYQTTNYDPLHFPNTKVQNPYDLYRDTTSWYRMIDPGLADPAEKYRDRTGGVLKAIETAIDKAERFHRSLGDYYHPNTYAFYGNDKAKASFVQLRWVAHYPGAARTVLTPANLTTGRHIGNNYRGQRRVIVEGKAELNFETEAQDGNGDGTVPYLSGAGPAGKVKQVFATGGYDHQGSYKNDDMLMLTLRLIVKIVQEMS